MSLTITHTKTNTIPDWDQQKLDAAISAGLYPQGTRLADIVLPSDWNHSHEIADLAGGMADAIHAATSKATPVDADELPIVDSAASNVLKKLTWLNLKATIKTYFDTIYMAILLQTTTVSSSSGVVTIDLSSYYRRYELTLTENVTSWVFTNVPSSGYMREILVDIVQHASSPKTVVTPATTGRNAGGFGVWVASTVAATRETLVIHAFSDSTRAVYPTGVQS